MKAFLVDLKLILGLSVFAAFLILLDSVGLLRLPKSLIQTVTIPVQYGLYQSAVSWGNQWAYITSFRQVAMEDAALKKQLGEILVENSSLRTRLRDNETLVAQYDKLNPTTYDLLPARVIGAGRYLTVDKGSDDGIRVGQVVVYKDTYVGQIKQVSPKTSQVILPSDPDSKVAVYSQGENERAKGILEGQFGSELLMDKILHQESIAAGNLVYSEGTEEKLPKGLIMGNVTEVSEKQNGVFKTAKVVPIYSALDLNLVFIVRN